MSPVGHSVERRSGVGLRRRRSAKSLFDGLHQAIGPKWLVQDRLKPFLPGFDNGVRRIPAEAGHQDDRYVRLDFPESFEGFVTIEIGQADVHQGRRVGRLPR